jgi:DNA-binding response OmpR family regulator
LVEDDAHLGRLMETALAPEGYRLELATCVDDAHELMATRAYDLILLDLGLPGRSGLSFLRDLRERRSAAPVIIISARERTEQRIAGLDAGADDYLVKPVDLDELLARIRSQMRRSERRPTDIVVSGDVALDLTGKVVTRDGHTIVLTAKEYDVLALLMRRAGRFVAREEIEDAVYGDDRDVTANALEATIVTLRRKLGRTFILTARGLGYMVAK